MIPSNSHPSDSGLVRLIFTYTFFLPSLFLRVLENTKNSLDLSIYLSFWKFFIELEHESQYLQKL